MQPYPCEDRPASFEMGSYETGRAPVTARQNGLLPVLAAVNLTAANPPQLSSGDCCALRGNVLPRVFVSATMRIATDRNLSMRKLSLDDALRAGRLFRLLAIGAFAVLAALGMSRRDCLGADCREKNRSRNSTGVPRAGNAGEQGRRPRSPAHRAAGPGHARYGSHACPELPPFRL